MRRDVDGWEMKMGDGSARGEGWSWVTVLHDRILKEIFKQKACNYL